MSFYRCNSGGGGGGNDLLPAGKAMYFSISSSAIVDESYYSTEKQAGFNANATSSEYIMLSPQTVFTKVKAKGPNSSTGVYAKLFSIKDATQTSIGSMTMLTDVEMTFDFSQALSDCDAILIQFWGIGQRVYTAINYTFS